ncbi:hypothetical protein EDD11_010433 [Mortierella claussenii]|nr:hypothetical protein EDD11_010433 [Mortierella claussenii]
MRPTPAFAQDSEHPATHEPQRTAPFNAQNNTTSVAASPWGSHGPNGNLNPCPVVDRAALIPPYINHLPGFDGHALSQVSASQDFPGRTTSITMMHPAFDVPSQQPTQISGVSDSGGSTAFVPDARQIRRHDSATYLVNQRHTASHATEDIYASNLSHISAFSSETGISAFNPNSRASHTTEPVGQEMSTMINPGHLPMDVFAPTSCMEAAYPSAMLSYATPLPLLSDASSYPTMGDPVFQFPSEHASQFGAHDSLNINHLTTLPSNVNLINGVFLPTTAYEQHIGGSHEPCGDFSAFHQDAYSMQIAPMMIQAFQHKALSNPNNRLLGPNSQASRTPQTASTMVPGCEMYVGAFPARTPYNSDTASNVVILNTAEQVSSVSLLPTADTMDTGSFALPLCRSASMSAMPSRSKTFQSVVLPTAAANLQLGATDAHQARTYQLDGSLSDTSGQRQHHSHYLRQPYDQFHRLQGFSNAETMGGQHLINDGKQAPPQTALSTNRLPGFRSSGSSRRVRSQHMRLPALTTFPVDPRPSIQFLKRPLHAPSALASTSQDAAPTTVATMASALSQNPNQITMPTAASTRPPPTQFRGIPNLPLHFTNFTSEMFARKYGDDRRRRKSSTGKRDGASGQSRPEPKSHHDNHLNDYDRTITNFTTTTTMTATTTSATTLAHLGLNTTQTSDPTPSRSLCAMGRKCLKKTRNSFIIYRSERSKVNEALYKSHNANGVAISHECATAWKQEDQTVRDYYKLRSEIELAEYQQSFPIYGVRPLEKPREEGGGVNKKADGNQRKGKGKQKDACWRKVQSRFDQDGPGGSSGQQAFIV